MTRLVVSSGSNQKDNPRAEMRLLLATQTHLLYITTQSTIRGVNDRVYSSHNIHLDNHCCGTHFTTGFGTLPSLRAFLGADLHPAFLYLTACLLEMTHTTLMRILPKVTVIISREIDSVFSICFPTFTAGSGD